MVSEHSYAVHRPHPRQLEKEPGPRAGSRRRDARHCVVFPTRNGGCHTLWTLGHLAYIELLVVRTFMLGESNPLAHWEETFDGADTSGDISRFPPLTTFWPDVVRRANRQWRCWIRFPKTISTWLAQTCRRLRRYVWHLSPLPAVCRRPLVHASGTVGRCAPGGWAGTDVGVGVCAHVGPSTSALARCGGQVGAQLKPTGSALSRRSGCSVSWRSS